jgi:uncharacterized membrane protein (UPF0127 family)
MKKASIALALIPLIVGCGQTPAKVGDTGADSAVPQSQTGHVESARRAFRLKDLQRVTLKANGHDIPAWVMDNDPKRAEGMMWLVEEDVKENEGMVFVFPDAKAESFWMENTILPLDIIYIKSDHTVANIQEGRPYDTASLPSKGPVQYVLEMRQGAAKKLGIKAGTKIDIPSSVKAK